MITAKKICLCSRDERIIDKVKRFEAVEIINDASDAEEIWNFNKTPVLLGDSGDLEIPAFNDDEDFEKQFIKWSHLNGFEPGELCTGKSYDTREDSCIFCAIARYKGGSTNAYTYNINVEKEVDCILYESPNFYITSELGALKCGFLQVIPKAHILSVAQFPTRIKKEYQQVCDDVERILVATFGVAPVAYFEHGSGPSGMTSHPKSIVHAHVHVLHGFTMSKNDLDRIQATKISNIEEAAHTHYFSYQSGARGQLFGCYDDRVYVPRQYARQIIANELGYPPGQYNWRKNEFKENVHHTLYYVWRTLKSSNLGERITERTECFVRAYSQREGFNEH